MSDREQLAVALWPAMHGRDLIDSDYENVAWLDTLEIAGAILSSDWLAAHDAAVRESVAEAIEGTPWEVASDRGPAPGEDQKAWYHGANAGVAFAARIARTTGGNR